MTDGVVIRIALREDVPAILALLMDDDLKKLSENVALTDYDAAFDVIADDVNQILAVATLGGDVAGCLQITFIPGLSRGGMWRAHIEAVRIARSRRGKGLGTVLLNWALARCKERGCGLVQLLSDSKRAEAHRFYEFLGFKATHLGFKLYL